MACDGKTRFHEGLTKESRDPVGENVGRRDPEQPVLGGPGGCQFTEHQVPKVFVLGKS